MRRHAVTSQLCWQLCVVSLVVYIRKVVKVSEVCSIRDIPVCAGLCHQRKTRFDSSALGLEIRAHRDM